MASELHEGSTDNHAVRRYTLTITVAIPPPHRALTVTVRRTAESYRKLGSLPASPQVSGVMARVSDKTRCPSPFQTGMAIPVTRVEYHRYGHHPCH
jgi:hypothetical protein